MIEPTSDMLIAWIRRNLECLEFALKTGEPPYSIMNQISEDAIRLAVLINNKREPLLSASPEVQREFGSVLRATFGRLLDDAEEIISSLKPEMRPQGVNSKRRRPRVGRVEPQEQQAQSSGTQEETQGTSALGNQKGNP